MHNYALTEARMGKRERQKAIKELISKKEFASQAELLAALKKEYRIVATQAAVSRDLATLGVVKGKKYALMEEDVKKQILSLAIRKIVHNEALIVVHTVPGLAAFVGDSIDALPLDSLGSLAGENVVFVTPVSTAHIAKTCAKLKAFLGAL